VRDGDRGPHPLGRLPRGERRGDGEAGEAGAGDLGVPPSAHAAQNCALFPHMTVARNIAFPLRMQGRPPRSRPAPGSEGAALPEGGEARVAWGPGDAHLIPAPG
jgi:hypothetical protein